MSLASAVPIVSDVLSPLRIVTRPLNPRSATFLYKRKKSVNLGNTRMDSGGRYVLTCERKDEGAKTVTVLDTTPMTTLGRDFAVTYQKGDRDHVYVRYTRCMKEKIDIHT